MKVVMKRKGLMDISELQAYSQAYGKPIGYKDYRRYVFFPSFLMAVFAFGLCYFWWVALICGAIGAFYGFKVIMPKSIKRSYEMNSLQERNRFINSTTQILSDKNKQIPKALELAKVRAKGELREDIERLESQIQGSDKFQLADAFSLIATKYEKDVVFTQYLEQLETALLEGRNNIETLKQITAYHNSIVKKTKIFLKIKDGHFSALKQMLRTVGLVIIVITFSWSFDFFYETFARTPIGWISGGIFYIINLLIVKGFFKSYFDDEIMSLGGKK